MWSVSTRFEWSAVVLSQESFVDTKAVLNLYIARMGRVQLVVGRVLGLGLKDLTLFVIFLGEREDSLFIKDSLKDSKTQKYQKMV